MIQLETLSVHLGQRLVVDDLSLTLHRGRVTVIIGPNGAGKTSLLRALACLVRPSSGKILLDGDTLSDLKAEDRARRIGYLPQNGVPAWAVTVRDMVALGRIPHIGRFAAPNAQDDAAVETAMADADILHLADRRVDSLSGGERARAKFARILAGESDWILADEPLANLDPSHQRDTLRLLKQAAQSGKGVVVVLHQLNAAARLTDDLLLLKQGRVCGFGPCSEVLTSEALMTTFDMAMEIVTLGGRTAILPR